MQTDRPAASRATVEHVLNLVPAASFLLSAAYSELRSGVIVRCVQQVAMHPPMILVAMEKGQPLSPIIRDSRNFALCVLDKNDRMTNRLFATSPDQTIDPFLTLPHLIVPGGSPVPLRALGYIACELVRHLDIEADYEVYIGMVHHAGLVEKPVVKRPRPGAARAHLHARQRKLKKGAVVGKNSNSIRQSAPPKLRRSA